MFKVHLKIFINKKELKIILSLGEKMEKNIEEIINVSDYLYKNKLVAGKAGNVSARFKGEDGDVIAITPTLKSLYELNEEDIVSVDLEGNLLTKGKPSSEVDFHLEIYKKRSDVMVLSILIHRMQQDLHFLQKELKDMKVSELLTLHF